MVAFDGGAGGAFDAGNGMSHYAPVACIRKRPPLSEIPSPDGGAGATTGTGPAPAHSVTEQRRAGGEQQTQRQQQQGGVVAQLPPLQQQPQLVRQPSEVINPRKGYACMVLLALQYGLQPLVIKSFIDRQAVSKVSLVVATEIAKIAICAFTVAATPGLRQELQGMWTLRSSLAAAALPAGLYALQNWLAQIGYMNLPSLTFNLLNQTKTLSAAVCLFLVMGKRQTPPQILALLLLAAAALLLHSQPGSVNGGGGSDSSSSSSSGDVHWELGIFPVLGASLISGFCAAVTQRSLQEKGRNSFLLCAELAVYGIVTLMVPLLLTGGLQVFHGFWAGWTPWTLVPVATQAVGGLIVGQVTKHAGSVNKGFALIGGILVTAASQAALERQPLSPAHYVSALLVALSTLLHARQAARPKVA